MIGFSAASWTFPRRNSMCLFRRGNWHDKHGYGCRSKRFWIMFHPIWERRQLSVRLLGVDRRICSNIPGLGGQVWVDIGFLLYIAWHRAGLYFIWLRWSGTWVLPSLPLCLGWIFCKEFLWFLLCLPSVLTGPSLGFALSFGQFHSEAENSKSQLVHSPWSAFQIIPRFCTVENYPSVPRLGF